MRWLKVQKRKKKCSVCDLNGWTTHFIQDNANISTIRTSYWVETCKSHNFNACEYSFFLVRFWKPLLQLQKSRFINNLHVHYTFLYISLPSVHDYDVKMSNFTFMDDVNKGRRNFLSFQIDCGPQEINSREIRPHLTFSAHWNKRYKVWRKANSF